MAKNQHKKDLINLAESYDKILNEMNLGRATPDQVRGKEEASQTADVADHELIKWAMTSTANYDRDYGQHALILSGRKGPPTLKPEVRDALIAIYNKAEPAAEPKGAITSHPKEFMRNSPSETKGAITSHPKEFMRNSPSETKGAITSHPKEFMRN